MAVIALGLLVGSIGQAANDATAPPEGGWFAYAPNTSITFDPPWHSGAFATLVMHVIAIGVWTAASLWILRDPAKPAS